MDPMIINEPGDSQAEERLHYYAFAFTGRGLDTSPETRQTASIYIGYPDQVITLPRIEEARRGAEMHPSSVLIGVSYLGHLTPLEFNPERANAAVG